MVVVVVVANGGSRDALGRVQVPFAAAAHNIYITTPPLGLLACFLMIKFTRPALCVCGYIYMYFGM
jgi:hypothetical protein